MVAEEANTEQSFMCVTSGQQNLHHTTQQVVPKELEEFGRFPTRWVVFYWRSHNGHLQTTPRKDKMEGGTA
jgi:hypothetical protein